MERPFPPPAFLKKLVALTTDAEALQHVRAAVRGLRGLGFSWEACEELAGQLKVDTSDAAAALEAANHLYEAARSWGDDWETRLQEFLGLVVGKDIATEDATRQLTTLCAPQEEREADRHRDWLRRGLLRNAMKFSTFVDLRPAYSPAKTSINELIPVVIFAIDDEYGESETFQLSMKSVRDLRKTIDQLEAKLKTLEDSTILAPLLSEKRG